MSNKMLDALKRASKVKPIAKKNGIDIVSYEDYVALSQADLMNNEKDMGERPMNPDGSIARSKRKHAATNIDVLLDNRYRKVKGSKIQIVNDYRAMKEQETGRIYAKNVLAYEVAKDKEKNKLYLVKTVLVSADEFVNQFTHKLNAKAMLEVLPVIQDNIGSFEEDDLPI